MTRLALSNVSGLQSSPFHLLFIFDLFLRSVASPNALLTHRLVDTFSSPDLIRQNSLARSLIRPLNRIKFDSQLNYRQTTERSRSAADIHTSAPSRYDQTTRSSSYNVTKHGVDLPMCANYPRTSANTGQIASRKALLLLLLLLISTLSTLSVLPYKPEMSAKIVRLTAGIRYGFDCTAIMQSH
jgi:hypothetical protein